MYMCEPIYIYIYRNIEIQIFGQSAGAVEYTDCFSAGRKTPTSNECPVMTLNNLMVRFW